MDQSASIISPSSTMSHMFTDSADNFLGHCTCQKSIKQKEIKRFTQGLNLKRNLSAGPYCTSAPFSPLWCVLVVGSVMAILKKENP